MLLRWQGVAGDDEVSALGNGVSEAEELVSCILLSAGGH